MTFGWEHPTFLTPRRNESSDNCTSLSWDQKSQAVLTVPLKRCLPNHLMIGSLISSHAIKRIDVSIVSVSCSAISKQTSLYIYSISLLCQIKTNALQKGFIPLIHHRVSKSIIHHIDIRSCNPKNNLRDHESFGKVCISNNTRNPSRL